MRLLWVELRDYRNHAHTRVDLGHDGIIVVAGPNGEGKTNLLEAMHFLYSLGSPRVSASEPLVRHGADAAYVRGEFETRDGRVLVEVEIRRKGANRVQVDRSTVRRRRDLRRAVRVVLFGPFDLPIVTGDPARRRGFMDEIVVLLQPTRDTLTSSYERVLRQRNRLLKEHEGRGAPSELEAWDEQLIRTGTAVIEARAEAVNAIAPPASEAFSAVSGYDLVVRYAPNVPTTDGEAGFRHRLDERRSDELQRRTSLVGPHRDGLDAGGAVDGETARDLDLSLQPDAERPGRLAVALGRPVVDQQPQAEVARHHLTEVQPEVVAGPDPVLLVVHPHLGQREFGTDEQTRHVRDH